MLVIDRLPQRKFIELELSQGFYNILPSATVNATLELHSHCESGYLGVDSNDKLAIHLFVEKLSVIATYADKRGLTVEYFNCIGGSQFSILIQWKEMGIRPSSVSESIVKEYLSKIKDKLMTTFLPLILTRGSKARRAMLIFISEISVGTAMWSQPNGLRIIEEDGVLNI